MKRYLSRAAYLLMTILLCVSITGCGAPKPKTDVQYTVYNQSEYARDGKKCVGYRVIIPKTVTEAQLKEVFDVVKDGDGYYLHTMWVYNTNDEAKAGLYTVAMLEEETKGEVTVTLR